MLHIKNLTKRYDDLLVLDHIDFQVGDEEIVAIIGPSGCGKSTLLNIISGLKQADEGKLDGIDNHVSFVFQEDRLLPWKTVWNNISVVNDRENRQEIQSLINEVGLQGFEDYYPSQLSGGMRKRCGIARAFYYKSNLLLMDEPFQGLDYALRQEMLQMLLRIWKMRKQSVLFITHEIEEAWTVANRILVLSNRPATIIKNIQLPRYEERGNNRQLFDQIRCDVMNIASS